MKLAALALLAASAPSLAQPMQVWARQFGTPLDESVGGVIGDGAGGLVMTGYTYGDLAAPNAGSADVFIIRYNAAGTQLWVKQFGSASFEQCRGIAAVGTSGGAIIVGSTSGNLAGPALGGGDAWLAVYDGAGNQVGVRQFGTPQGDFAIGVATNPAGRAFIAGSTSGNFAAPNAGGEDAILTAFDATTNTILWARQFGTAGTDLANGVTPDLAGGVYVTGFTAGPLGGPGFGSNDAYLARYDNAGVRLWIVQIGTTSSELAGQVAPDGAGGVIWMGSTSGALSGPQQGMGDIFLARYDPAGNQVWLRQFGSPEYEYGTDLRLVSAANMLFAGTTYGDLFGGTNAGSSDGLLARFDPIANVFVWGHEFGTAAADSALGVTSDDPSRMYVVGETSGDLGGTNFGGRDAYIVRFAPECYPDCNTDGTLNLADFGCFQTKFALADAYADCNGDGVRNLADFGCFQTQFALGCP